MATKFFAEKSIKEKGVGGLNVVNLRFIVESHGVGGVRKRGKGVGSFEMWNVEKKKGEKGSGQRHIHRRRKKRNRKRRECPLQGKRIER